jgi:hypothetical protein
MTPSDADIIATRIFERDDGEVELRVYRPYPGTDPACDNTPDDPLYKCEYSLHFPDGEVRNGIAMGCDSVEALLLMFARAQLELKFVMDGSGDARPQPRWLDDEDLGLDIIHF